MLEFCLFAIVLSLRIIHEVNNALVIWSQVIIICFLFQLEMKGMTEERGGQRQEMSMKEVFGWKYQEKEFIVNNDVFSGLIGQRKCVIESVITWTQACFSGTPKRSRRTRKVNQAIVKQIHAQYYNPDPLVRLIGDAKESVLQVDKFKITALIDSGAQISTMTESFVKLLKLQTKSLRRLLKIESFLENEKLSYGIGKVTNYK